MTEKEKKRKRQNQWECPCGHVVTRRYRSSSSKRYFCTAENRYRNMKDLQRKVVIVNATG